MQPVATVALVAESPVSAPVRRRPRRSRRLANESPTSVPEELTDTLVPEELTDTLPAPPPAIVSLVNESVLPLDDAAAMAEEQALRLAIERSLVASSAHPPASAANDTPVTSEPPAAAAAAAAEVVITRANNHAVPVTDSENDFQAVNRKRPASVKRACAKKSMRAATKKLFVPKSRIFWTKDPRTGGRSSVLCVHILCCIIRRYLWKQPLT